MAGLKERLIQFVLRGKDEMSPAARKGAAALAALTEQGNALGQALDQAKNSRGLADSLAGASRAAEKAKSDLQSAEGRIEELRRALDASPDSKGLQYSLQQAEREARNCRRAVTMTAKTLQDLEQSAREAGIDVNNLADEQKRLRDEVERGRAAVKENAEAVQELDRANRAAARSAADHTSRVAAARTAMSAGVRQAMGYAAAFVGIDAAISLVSRGLGALRDGIGTMLSTGDQFEGLQTRMNSLMGSVAAGEEATAWIKDFAKNTPLALEDVTESFALLKSYGLDPMGGVMQAIVDKNEQLGGGMERLTGLSSALGQAWAKQKLQTEEILQLVERGVPVWELLGKVTGKNTEQLQKLASEGRIGRDVIQALIVEMGKSADGAAAENMSRLSGLMSNLADTATDFYNRIANAGALDYVKGRLSALATTIAEMDSDGRLDKLAKALSDAFVQGAQRVEEFARTLVGVDFKKLTDDSTAWLSDFGTKIDEAAVRVQLFFAPFRTLFNGLTSGLSLAAGGITDFVSRGLQQMEILSRAVPDMMGGDKLRASIAEARGAMDALTAGFVAQIEQDGADIAASWDTTTKKIATSAAEQTTAISVETENRRKLDQAYADELVANQQRIKDAAVDAAISGTQAITSMAEAAKLIDTASSVSQLEGLREAILRAFRDGKISLTEYQQSTGLLQGKLRDLRGASDGAAGAVSNLDEALSDLSQVQDAISGAKTDVDVTRIKKALRDLYSGGKISAQEFTKAQAELNKKVAELRVAAESSTRAVKEQGQAIKEASSSVGSGLREVDDGAVEAAGGMNWFAEVLTRARTPLAEMSAAALDAFDALQGINKTEPQVDTSSLEKTSESLEKTKRRAIELQGALDLEGSRASGFGRWMMETFIRSEQVKVAFLTQKKALQDLMRDYESGAISVEKFEQRAKSARRNLDLLDESDLSSLDSAIESAKQQMESLGQSTRSTLDGLQMELLQLKGTQEEIEKAKFEARRNDLKAQLAEAEATGTGEAAANLRKALQVLREVEKETLYRTREAEKDKARKEEEARAQAEAKPVAPVAPPATNQRPAEPTTIIRLESPSGNQVDVSVPTGQQPILLDLLRDAGMRAL